MKKYIFFLFLFSCTITYGQRNFKEGYIIKQQGDTTFGQVAYRTNRTSALITHFRSADGRPVQTFEPKDLVGFGYIGDKSMESKMLSSVDNTDYRAFVEIIFKGKINLYRYKNDYIFEKENTLYLITNRELVGLNPGEKTLVYSDDDVRTIANLVADCGLAVIDQVRFNIVDKHLIQILKVYHQCLHQDYQVFKEDKPWTKLTFGMFGGANSSKLSFESENQTNDFLSKGDFNNARSLFFGIEVSISSPRVTDAYELITGVQLMKTNYYGFSELNTPTGTERNDVFINIDKLIVPLGLRYTMVEKIITPYFSAGINFTTHSTLSMEWLSESLRDQIITTSINERPFDRKSTQVGLWASIGITKNILDRFTGFVELKFESSNGLVRTGNGQNFDLNSSITNLQLLLGIRF